MSAGSRLARALEASAWRSGCRVRVGAADERPWSSATFVGARHAIRLEGECSPAWLAMLAEDGVMVPGHVLAEIAVEPAGEGARITALTLET